MDKLKSDRKTIKQSLTKFVTYLEKYVNEEQSEDKIAELKLRLEKIEESWDRFDNIQSKIEELDTDGKLNSDEYRTTFENTFYTNVGKARNIIRHAERWYNNVIESNATAAQLPVEYASSEIQLPVLTLPKFNGEYTKWLLFKDSFKPTIHENDSLKNIEKFRYLRSVLHGDALQLISSIETTNDNYEIAWKLLNDRYENEKIIIHTHLKALFEMPSLTKETYVNLRQTIDNFQTNVRALEALKEPIQHWDTILVYLLAGKLDAKTRRDWEKENGDKKKSSLQHLIDFLANRCQILEMSEKVSKLEVNKASTKRNVSLTTTVINTCLVCNKPKHAVYKCYKFLALSAQDRIAEVKRLKLCINCLRPDHQVSACKGKKCHLCNKQHNSLLHINKEDTVTDQTASGTTPDDVTNAYVAESRKIDKSQSLLPTAIINIRDTNKNKYYKARALLDTGSQSNFITRKLANKLQVTPTKSNITVSGFNATITKTNLKCEITIASLTDDFNKPISCLITDKITNQIPTITINKTNLEIPDNLQLADNSFHITDEIDILLGATTVFEIIGKEKIILGKHQPILQNTRFGWIVIGDVPLNSNNQTTSFLCVDNELQQQIEKFWTIEESPITKRYSKEEEECLMHYNNTTTRDKSGKFIVQMPLKETSAELGDTMNIAIKRLASVERKFQSNPELKQEYCKFMHEYETLGHMTKITTSHSNVAESSYYLPHHPVCKTESSTTKLRVVFDGSAQPPIGYSLNQVQKVGPTIQPDLFSLLLRFRTHCVALTADVEKMYRQVWIDKAQRHLQQIVWRKDSSHPIDHFQLNTVTYGQAAAPFLAIRSLSQLGIDTQDSNARVSDVIQNEFYVDDLLTGARNDIEAFELFKDLTETLAHAKFNLRKWSSNSAELLRKIVDTNTCQPTMVYVCEDPTTKTLGIHWNPSEDIFKYSVNLSFQKPVTKRTTLSVVAKIYDPLGLISPIIIIAKMFIQKLWLQKLGWDDYLPVELEAEWHNFINSAQQVNRIKIPRFMLGPETKYIQLHGFSDASTTAYAACVYIRGISDEGNVTIQLACAKTKVAPLKTLSIPRLELCGAVLLTKIANKTIQALRLPVQQTFYWTDSTVVLNWITTSPHLLKSFVANRVTEIQTNTLKDSWNHVPTKQNPADIASRGAYSHSLIESKLWWQGPEWLAMEESQWPSPTVKLDYLPELKTPQICCHTTESIDVFERFSNLDKLLRVYSYVLRFKNNCLTSKKDRRTGPITLTEINKTKSFLVKLAQRESFTEELRELSKGNEINKKSKLFNLNPYIAEDGLLRVGGRLENSTYDIDKKHPMLLDAKHAFTKLIFKRTHVALLHAGPQQLLSHVRETYWPIGGRNLAKKTVRTCVKCFRAEPRALNQLMGNLPAHRFEARHPFYISGVDYAGPFLLKTRKGRGAQQYKAYVCLIVCLVTKAIHLELVSSLSTEVFIMALRRFIARRGKPLHLYSDNGTNFVGANNKLKELAHFLRSNESDIVENCSKEEINWHFIPAHSPHFGGMWEAGVKSTKFHLRRVVGNASLTYEEFNTFLIQIEAILNSRPLTPLSSDVNDIVPLTPAHFLIGKPLTSIPDPDLQHIPDNRLATYQRIQQLNQHFWRRWSKEYVSELQVRHKWKSTQQNLKIGTIVLIKEDQLPPLSWMLGKVEEIHPGRDGIVRVVTIRTPRGNQIRRAITKICPLPCDTVSEV